MTVIKSKLVNSECKHHGVTEFYYYERQNNLICATCAREKKRIRDSMKRMELNLPYKKKIEKIPSPDLTLSKYYIKEYLPTIDNIARTYKIKWSEKGLLRVIKSTSNESEFLIKVKDYLYNLGLRKIIQKHNWQHSTVLKYRYGVRETFKSIAPDIKNKIRSEMFELSKESVLIPIQILKDRVDELPIIKVEIKPEIKPEIKEDNILILKEKNKKKFTLPDVESGFIGVSVITCKREVYYIAKFKYKYIGKFLSPIEAAIAYNKEVINVFGDYAISNGLLNTFDNMTYLGCKGVTIKNGKYVSVIEFDNIEVYNKTFDILEDAIKEYDREVIKYYGKDSDKLNYKIIEREIVSCVNVPRYITERYRKNKLPTWRAVYKHYIGTFKTQIEACIAFNNAIVDLGVDHLFVKFETSTVRERVKNIL